METKNEMEILELHDLVQDNILEGEVRELQKKI